MLQVDWPQVPPYRARRSALDILFIKAVAAHKPKNISKLEVID